MKWLALALAVGCGPSKGIIDDGDFDDGDGSDVAPRSTTRVEAYKNWTSGERYVRAGDQITLSAEGVWNMYEDEGEPYGPDGAGWAYDDQPCDTGTLLAQVGLHFNDTFTCVGASATFEASRDGLLYFRSLGFWGGATGHADVTVEAVGTAAPIIDRADVDSVDPSSILAPVMELRGEHIIVHVEAEHFIRDQADAGASLDRFDAWYQSHATLSNATPYEGQHIRFYPDADIRDIGAWMLSGNPVRIDPDAAADQEWGSNLLATHMDEHSAWGFVHELGHDFSYIGGGTYMVGGGTIEGWSNVWSLYTLEAFGHPEAERDYMEGTAEHLANPDYDTLTNDAWLSLAMLMELKEAQGWGYYEDFFALANSTEQPGRDEEDMVRWAWLRDTLHAASGVDPITTFERWGVTLP